MDQCQVEEGSVDGMGYRVVIDVVPDPARPNGQQAREPGYTALGSMTALPEPETRALDHHETFAFASGEDANQAVAAIAGVLAAWLPDVKLTTDRLWRLYGEERHPRDDDTLDI